MQNEFDDVMATRTDAELISILKSAPGDYQESALESAKREVKKRNLSEQQIGSIGQEIDQKKQADDIKANIPLPTIWKILAFIFPGIMQVIFAGVMKADGYDRKFREFVKWTFYGYLFYGGIVLLIVLSIYGFHF